MNGVHDMGGMHCFGNVDVEDDQLFHHDWERQVLAMALAMGATGVWNLDESRSARESLPAAYYLSAGYYRIWLVALEKLMLRHQLVTQQELSSGASQGIARKVPRVLQADSVDKVLQVGNPADRPSHSEPQFTVGRLVTVRNLQGKTHTRLPAYIRKCKGQIVRIHGCHVFPDSHAKGEGENPQWLYNVKFDRRDLWGADADSGFVHVDCWESYLSCEFFQS